MKFINLTGHPVTDTNTNKTFDPKGLVRTDNISTKRYRANGIPVFSTSTSQLDPLPDPEQGVAYIVSNLYLNTCPERTDVVAPGKVVRDEIGKPIACRGFRCNTPIELLFEAWFVTSNLSLGLKELVRTAFYAGRSAN